MYKPKHRVAPIMFDISYYVYDHGSTPINGTKLQKREIEGDNQFDAVSQLVGEITSTFPGVYVEIIKVSSYMKGYNSDSLVVGREYVTLDGTKVKIMGVTNPGTDNECVYDQFMIHRYSRRRGDIGRCTGSPNDAPMNIKLGESWYNRDFDMDAYEEVNTNCRHARSEHVVHNYRDLGATNGKLPDVKMDYRDYIIERYNDNWYYRPVDQSRMTQKTKSRSTAQMWIDLFLDGEEASFDEEEIQQYELKE